MISTASRARPEFEVVWNGVHHNCDADLLNVVATPEKLAALPRPPKRLDAADLVEAALPTREGQAVTVAEVIATTGLPGSSVSNALYQLRHRGRVKTAPDRAVRAPQRYWRTVDASNETVLVGAVGDWLRRE